MSKPRRTLLTWWIWLVYALLLAAAIPWYWTAADPPRLVLGMPAWAATAVLTSIAISVWTAFLIAGRWPEDTDDHEIPLRP